ncbi:MAG TPA: DUF6691 family protein [Candidatus Limnocylindria bacterium]|nr:DUF6691 family protein [Candidatus Limnocylindria bacterium]
MALLGPFLAGAVFALGLGVSGMTHPEKIIGFLDVAGAWDPSLAFVMVGAIAVYAPLSRRIVRRAAPLLGAAFSVPTRRDLDPKLILGAALFGIGWGLGGFCPGPAILALLSWSPGVLAFVVSMVAGMAAFELQTSAPMDIAPSRRLSVGGTDG